MISKWGHNLYFWVHYSFKNLSNWCFFFKSTEKRIFLASKMMLFTHLFTLMRYVRNSPPQRCQRTWYMLPAACWDTTTHSHRNQKSCRHCQSASQSRLHDSHPQRRLGVNHTLSQMWPIHFISVKLNMEQRLLERLLIA